MLLHSLIHPLFRIHPDLRFNRSDDVFFPETVSFSISIRMAPLNEIPYLDSDISSAPLPMIPFSSDDIRSKYQYSSAEKIRDKYRAKIRSLSDNRCDELDLSLPSEISKVNVVDKNRKSSFSAQGLVSKVRNLAVQFQRLAQKGISLSSRKCTEGDRAG